MSLPSTQKPAWYEHNLHNERGEVVNTIIADYDGQVFGRPGIDHSSTFTVVTQALEPLGVKPVRIELRSEVERLRAELGEAKGEYDRSANKVAALTAQLADLEALHGGELGLPKEGWPAYHKRKMESLRDLTAGHYQRKLAARDSLLRDAISDMNSWCAKHPLEASLTKHLVDQIEVVLSASDEPCSEPCQAATAPKISPAALREAMENLAVKARAADLPPFSLPAAVRQAPLVMLGGVCVRVSCSGLKWYHDQLIDDRWEPLTVCEFEALLAEALAKS